MRFVPPGRPALDSRRSASLDPVLRLTDTGHRRSHVFRTARSARESDLSGAFSPPDPVTPATAWRLLVTPTIVGAFGPDTPVATMSNLWRVAGAPNLGLEELVGAIPTQGRDAVHSFAVGAVGPS